MKNKNGQITAGIFSELDMSQIEKAERQNEANGKGGQDASIYALQDVIEEDMVEGEFDDFLKQGGLDVDEMEAAASKGNQMFTSAKEGKNDKEDDDEEKEVYDTEPDENMKGFLNKQSNKLMTGED